VRVGGMVRTLQRLPDGLTIEFRLDDGSGAEPIRVRYRGIAPDTFADGVDVIVEGRLGADGTFRATTLLAKCASRYENAPEKYRNAPGYQRPATSATASTT